MHRILYILLCLVLAGISASAQEKVKGRVIDALTRQALPNVTVQAGGTGCQTDASGRFSLHCPPGADSMKASCIGYAACCVKVSGGDEHVFVLEPLAGKLGEIIVSAGRQRQYRSDAPIAISTLNAQTLRETKATSLEQVLNKVSGVYMVDLGNEQHTMAIRQPIGYKSLFLYLEDGLPIRTVGDFNHNALIEINMAALQRIEVIRGPASSLYGSEAVGGAVNFLTAQPTPVTTGKIQAEMSDGGYKRTDFNLSGTKGKLGVWVGGYYADQRNGRIEHSDFHKLALTLKTQYKFDGRTTWTNAATFVDYRTDQTGGVDSANFYSRNYKSMHTFSYRLVKAFRFRSTLEKQWSDADQTSFSVFYRHNEIGQNPFYAIKTTSNPLKARGEINSDAFQSGGLLIQHRKRFGWKGASLTGGVSADYSPATYYARFIDVDRDGRGYFTGYTKTDSVLTDYKVDLVNTALYVQGEMNPFANMKLIAALRYDRMDYRFDNHLPPSAFTGSPDERNHYEAWTPKLGLTYDFGHNRGLYANYSVGFAPPNISELYRGVKVPTLRPASYRNFEIGGWMGFAKGKGHAEVSVYRMDGENEIISVRLADNSSENRNAGKTKHAGVEWSARYALLTSLEIRTSGTFARHDFVTFEDKGKKYDGNRMNTAPEWITNSEVTWKPIRHLRLGMEWQHVGSYFMDPANTVRYGGYELFNARAGYQFGPVECWVNCRNLFDATYATTAEKSAFGASYRPGPVRTFNFGVAYTFTAKQQS
ncbi:TonB-dependent receptor [Chitinophaga rhizosphaerae]|uniref:TonB-dependent receptor n=1 Tax=Chitinophaga rhizosphaerae TaxID=1864947 RepID=UPI000F809582|nr:TonB-dependent receptor [Chitinophaga rhizosphaerae]